MIPKKIKDKLKQLKYSHLKKIYEKNLSQNPENCKYNKIIILPNRSKLNICSFDMENNSEVDLCYKKEHSKDCNAFCPRKSKELLKEEFNEDLKDPQIRATKFKDINILYWLYPDLESEDLPEKNKSMLKRILSFLFGK